MSIANINFVAPVDCRVQVTVGFEAAVTVGGVSDFGSSDKYQIRVSQYTEPGAVFISSAFSATKPVALARAKYSDYFTGNVLAGNRIQVDLIFGTATTHTMTAWNVDMRVEIIKR
jgi:hypothetical protein